MPCTCCTDLGIMEMFSARRARADARRYRRRGLDARARRLVGAIQAAVPLSGASVLEIGAGVGSVSLELLRRGAARATIVEASPHAAVEARTLAQEAGVQDRLEIVVADYAAMEKDGRSYDVVVLDRVVCCYPDWRGLLAPAVAAAWRALAMTYPRDVWWARGMIGALNLLQALIRRRFRAHVHPPAAMHEELRRGGVVPRRAARVGPWELVIAPRR